MERRRANDGLAMVWYELSAMVMVFFGVRGHVRALVRRDVSPHSMVLWLINLIECSAVGEMGCLSFCPAAKFLVHRDQFQLSEIGGVFFSDSLVSRTIKIFRRDFLAFVRIKIFEICLRDGLRAVPPGGPV